MADQQTEQGEHEHHEHGEQGEVVPMEVYHRVFDLFDHDGNGTIDVNELGATLRMLGKNPSDCDVQEIVEKSDWDGNNKISFDEFCALVHREDISAIADRNSQQEIIDAFRKLDRADTGFVKVSHVRKLLQGTGERLTDEQLEEFISQADPNGDGHIDYVKFTEAMCFYDED